MRSAAWVGRYKSGLAVLAFSLEKNYCLAINVPHCLEWQAPFCIADCVRLCFWRMIAVFLVPWLSVVHP